MALFTPETAAEMAHKRWAAEKEAKLNPRILPAPAFDNADQNPSQAELTRTREHIDLLNQQLDQCDDPDTWDALTRSKERLFRIWARLAQLPSDPKPVQLKQPARAQAWSEPTPVQPSPTQSNPGPGPGPSQASG